MPRALDLPDREFLVPAYTLGAWLGDGTSAAAQITTADPEIIMRIEADGLVAVPSESARYRYQLLLPAHAGDATSPVRGLRQVIYSPYQ